MAVPTLQSLTVDGTSVVLTYSEALSSTLPSINRFAVLVNGVRVYASSSVATLGNGGTTIRFSLASAVPPGATIVITLADRHKSETPCNTTGLSPLGGQGAVRAWGSYTKPIPRGFPRPAAC
jgi:hypothetical protein